MKKRLCSMIAALMAAAFLLSACGPEPGAGESGSGSLFGQEDGSGAAEAAGGSEEAAGQEAAEKASTGTARTTIAEAEADGTEEAGAGISAAAGEAGTAAPASSAGTASSAEAADPALEPGTAGTAADPGAAADASAGSAPAALSAELVRLDDEALEELEAYLNEDSSYGFFLSCYERPEDIDLQQVFYTGAGCPREQLEEKEKELLLERLSMPEFVTSVTKVPEEYIEGLLARKAGITYEQSNRPLDGWAHIGRYGAWYHLHGDTNRQFIRCTDAWQQGDTVIVHYQTGGEPPESAAGAPDGTGAASQGSTEGGPSAAEAASTGGTAQEYASPEEQAQEQAPPEAEKMARYVPTYEAELLKAGEDYRFCSNVLWAQKDMIEAQSYQADLAPMGEVFFAPLYPDTEADPRADVTFALVKDHALLMTLGEMEPGNIRTDRVFTGVDAVDFTDHDGDGCTDILTVCSYQLLEENGNRGGDVREARVYTMKVFGEDGEEDALTGVPLLDEEKTAAVNRDVETLNITSITEYLTGRSDGKDKKYGSWKEAFADHLRGLNAKEYRGFALISLTEGRTPVFVQVGATTAKGATLVVYRNGTLEETWLNRNSFQYLEYDNLLYSASGIENLHYDTLYSIVNGRLRVSVQGYYGNRRFARLQRGADGEPVYQYFWDGGEVSANGYRDGLSFVFDASRAKTCGEEGLLTAEQMLEELE